MGSEGYLINQFIAERTNLRTDEWGGSATNRFKLAVAITRSVRSSVSADFIVIFRLSMLDLVDGGSDWNEVVALAQVLRPSPSFHLSTRSCE